MQDEFFQFSVDTLVAGLYVDDGTKLGFMKNLVVFRFSTSYADDASGHRFQRIHGGSVAVKLVEDGIAPVHHPYVFPEGQVFCLAQFHPVGIFFCYRLGSLQHDVRTLIFAPASVDADENPYLITILLSRFQVMGLDGERDKGGLCGEFRVIACPVFIESRHDAVALAGYDSVESFLLRAQPVFPFLQGVSVGPQGLSHIEIAVSQRLVVAAATHPIIVHPETAQDDLPVVPFQIAVDGQDALCLQLEKHGIDELYDIISAKLGQ